MFAHHSREEEERNTFQNALHLVPTWNMTDEIVFNYLDSLETPIMKLFPKYGIRKCF